MTYLKEQLKQSKGFTLIELLIVTVILAVIAGAIFATFSAGIKIWQRTNEMLPQEDINIFSARLERDLRNVIKFSNLNFTGKEEKISFPAIVDSQRLQKRTVGEVIYEYDTADGIVFSEHRDFAHISSERDGIRREVLEGVRSLVFRYYYFDEQSGEYVWEEEYTDSFPPLAVRVKVEFKDESKNEKFIKTIYIPTGK